jgi:clan AA aspartic protease
MIRGLVNDELEAIVHVTVVGSTGRRETVTAVVDTGYNGCLTLPVRLLKRLQLPWLQRGRAELADGNEIFFDVFEGAVIWHGRRKLIPIDESETTPLVGMGLLKGFELRMQVRTGGKVAIKRLRDRNGD